MRERRLFPWIFFFLFFVGQAPGQEPYRAGGALSPDTSSISTIQFDRTLQTFLWNARIDFGTAVQGLTIDFDQNIRSRLIRSAQNSIQDELGTRISVHSQLSDRWVLRGQGTSMILSDDIFRRVYQRPNRELDLGNLSQHQLLAGAGYRILPQVSASFLGGYEFASQEQVRDQGFAYRAEVRGDAVSLSDFDVSIDAGSARSFLSPRRLGADRISLAIVRDYGQSTINALHFQYGNLAREFYTAADPDIQRDYQRDQNIFHRRESVLGIVDTLHYRSGRASSLLVHAGYGSRIIDRGYRYKSYSNPAGAVLDSRIDEARLFGGVMVRSEFARWLIGGARLGYEEREERHSVVREEGIPQQTLDRQEQSVKRLSNIARRTTLGIDLHSRITERDVLNLTGSAGILRYDTPDSLNTDDRDELLLVIGVEAIHRFNTGMVLSLLADATLSHLVYLSRFQSANNNWNRIFRLRPRVDYSPAPWLTTVNAAEVLANYTVYDFEEQIAAVRSFSFRQASWSDSTSVKLGPRTEILVLASLRIYERGILKWREFRERPENYFVEESYWPQIVVGVMDHLSVGVGYRYFAQTRFRYEGRRRLFEQKLINEGPTVHATWRGKNGSMMTAEGWRESQKGAGARRAYSNLSLMVGITL